MSTKRLSRRTVLRGALATGAAITVPLPVLDIMLNRNGDAFAAGTPLPRRYVTWFFGNGVLPPLWVPAATGSGSAWSLSSELMPLASFKSWTTVISGLKQMVGNSVPHPYGSAAATTGAGLSGNAATAKSIDQIVAGLNTGGNLPSLEIGCTKADPMGSQVTLHTTSHRGANAPNYPEFDPQKVFARLFAGSSGTTNTTTAAQLMKLNQEKKSILDSVLADGAEINGLLGATDQQRLSDHLDAIREIETRMSAMPTMVTGTLGTPADPKTQGISIDTKSEAPPAVNKVMAQMLAVALASRITLNATYIFTLPAAHVYYRSVGSDMNDDFHNTICHTDPGDNAHQTRVDKGVIYAMQSLATFLDYLSKATEGAGTVLDSSLIYVTSDTAWGKIHDTNDWPVLLVGKAGGGLKGDQHLRFPGGNLSSVLLTIANLFGAKMSSIGSGGGQTSQELTGVRLV